MYSCATMEEDKFLKALETASRFAEKAVKELLMSVLKKSSEELFGDDPLPTDCGLLKIETPDEGTIVLRLELVDAKYRIPYHKFGRAHIQGATEILRLFTAAELYFQYAKHSFKLYDECNLVRSRHGSLHILGSPSDSYHISAVIL